MQKLMDRDTTGIGRVALGAVRAVMEIPQRILIRGFDDMTAANIALQREVYEDKLIEALIDPTVAADLKKGIDAVKPGVYFVTQAVARGATEGIQNILDDRFVPGQIDPISGRLQRGLQGAQMIESAKEVTQPEQTLQDPQAMLEGLSVPQVGGDVPIFEPLPDASPAPVTGGFDPATSAIVLPRADDRELAERLRGPLGGIASLA